MRTVTDTDDMDDMFLDELSEIWDDIRENYDTSDNSSYDRTVLDCAAELASDPGGESAYVWAIGLTVMAPYLTWLPGAGVADQAAAVLETADRALRDRDCPHDSHPYQSHDDEEDAHLAELLPALADESAVWDEDRPRSEWRRPRNAAGFARIGLDIIRPGSVTDVPPRLPLEAKDSISTLSALLHGYPKPWTDINDEISGQGADLSHADPADRAGRLQVVRAVTWYAVSGMVRKKSVLDGLAEAVEKVLPHFAGSDCAHDGHPALPDSGPNAAELGIRLSSAAWTGDLRTWPHRIRRGRPARRSGVPGPHGGDRQPDPGAAARAARGALRGARHLARRRRVPACGRPARHREARGTD